MFSLRIFPCLSSLLLFLLSTIGCQHSLPTKSKINNKVGGIILSLDKATMPMEVELITITLSRSDFSDIVRDFVVTDSSLTVRFDSLAIGV